MGYDVGGLAAHDSLTLAEDLVLCVTLEYAGRQWRWSTRPVDLYDEAGTAIPWDGGLPDLDVEQTLTVLSETPDLLTVPLELAWPTDAPSAASLRADGHDLAAATGEVALAVPGGQWAQRQVLLRGHVQQPEYGQDGEPVSLSLQEAPYEDEAVWPPDTARVTSETWPSAWSEYEGRYYPHVFGWPGTYRPTGSSTISGMPGSPGLVVERSGTDADTILIAGHRVTAGTVDLWYEDDTTSSGWSAVVGATVEHQVDGAGRVCAVIDVSGMVLPGIRTSSTYWVSWRPEGGACGMYSEDVAGGVAAGGAGEALLYWLRRSSLRLDLPRFVALRQVLDGYRVSWYVDEPVTPYRWITDYLLPLLPVSIVSGPRGLCPVLWQHDPQRTQALTSITVEPGITRVGRVGVDRGWSEIVQEVRVSYCVDAESGDAKRTAVVAPAGPEITQSSAVGASSEIGTTAKGGTYRSVHAESSWRRYIEPGRPWRSEEVNGEIIVEEPTAARVAQWRLVAHGYAHRLVSYELPQSWAHLELGAIVLWTDADLYLSEVVALVRARTRRDYGLVRVTLQLLDEQPIRRVTTGPDPLGYTDEDPGPWQ